MPSASALAPAKINLFLHITGRRPDHFHTLDSLFVFADVGDEVFLTPSDDLRFTISGPYASAVPNNANNLVMRVLQKIADTLGRNLSFHIQLNKILPVTAGIGGGSSDAAAAIRALSYFWPEVSGLDLVRLAQDIGADIPACLTARPVQVSGIGDVLTPISQLPEMWIVLVNHGVAIETPVVFGRFKEAQMPFSVAWPLSQKDISSINSLASALQMRGNDLQNPALLQDAGIGDLLDAVNATRGCLLSRMSGSGGTVYGLYSTEQDAQESYHLLQKQLDPAWMACSGVLRHAPDIAVSED